ncbi:MAG: hypothetical protein H0T46_07995 [Deltaproteobacteria bacterium]|nr:hypothetical protein [Deltaproteobacteria bacterium]
MITRIATFNTEPDLDPVKHEEFRQWMGTQPGLVHGYHLKDTKTGKVMSISFWTDRESMLAMKDRVFPGGPLNLKPDTVEILEVAHTFGPK